jgi:hypothetical protein
MPSKDTLNSKILAITLKINTEYPELSKYLNEMPITIPYVKNPDVNYFALEEYYNSLKNIVKMYNLNQKQKEM